MGRVACGGWDGIWIDRKRDEVYLVGSGQYLQTTRNTFGDVWVGPLRLGCAEHGQTYYGADKNCDNFKENSREVLTANTRRGVDMAARVFENKTRLWEGNKEESRTFSHPRSRADLHFCRLLPSSSLCSSAQHTPGSHRHRHTYRLDKISDGQTTSWPLQLHQKLKLLPCLFQKRKHPHLPSVHLPNTTSPAEKGRKHGERTLTSKASRDG